MTGHSDILFGNGICKICKNRHPSGYDCVAEKERLRQKMRDTSIATLESSRPLFEVIKTGREPSRGTSFPVWALAQKYGLDYGDVGNFFDRIRHARRKEPARNIELESHYRLRMGWTPFQGDIRRWMEFENELVALVENIDPNPL